eukprot:TRINITY_DN64098_c0_g1_i1.p1 TRINITY_DN64098_c0_g1~~TRINITY_DN64098_c0_g1_i1.p1  ORF type:complete len:504 (+),score=73.21 TRINITY_DN64098_c0_g1_i1:116-1513(+)
MASLEREAAYLLRSLFDFRGAAPQGAPRASFPSQSNRPVPSAGARQQASKSTNDDSSGSWPAPSVAQSLTANCAQKSERRTVHSESGLRVVDDTEFDDVVEPAPEMHNVEMEPTPAEAGIVATNRLPRAPRAPRPPRTTGSNNGSGVCRSGMDGDDQPKKTTVIRNVTEEKPQSSRMYVLEDEHHGERPSELQCGPVLCDVHVPEWARYELHEKTLDEVQAVEAMFPDEFQLLTPDVLRHLEECVATCAVSSRPEALCLQVMKRLHCDDGQQSMCVLVEFSLPPYYPTHSAMVELSWPQGQDGDVHRNRCLREMEQAIRTEVLRELECNEVILAVLDWLDTTGAERLAQAISTNPAAALTPKHESQLENDHASEQTSPSSEQMLSKQERIEKARAERMNGKYSESWDLCYAFVKHGACKEKNCPWRHTLPCKMKHEAGATNDSAQGEASVLAAESKAVRNGKRRG